MDADSLKEEGISLHLERKGIGFIHAPRVHPESTEVARLPAWIRKVIDAWQPISRISEDTVSLKSTKSHPSAGTAAEVEQRKFCLDYGSATSDLTGNDADKDLDEATKFALLDGAVCKQTRSLIRIVLKDDRLPITFVTGRIPSLGSLSGHGMARAESKIMTVDDASSVCLLWVDLFANMNPAMSSFADYLTRCPAAFLLHETFAFVPRHFPGFEWIRPWMSAKRAAFIGLQHPSDNEIRFLEDNHIYYQTADELASRGAEDSIGRALAVINPRIDLPIHLVINFFALDWKLATINDSAVEQIDETVLGGGAILIQDALTTLDVVLKTGQYVSNISMRHLYRLWILEGIFSLIL
ncbi:hypothetical protein RvY_02076-2 [Ramazzottius varieornatus]|uniref:Uncharacterized protein n=1 Tax=Ramazzottius varieornatus TaxID=947166 RepID=A0A1D1UIH0_RAMVA|nr:hypothetical protein RvY_02076-2 [Ramazzottius varieornatus]